MDINDIIPQQHYLSYEKYDKVIESFKDFKSYGDIYVIRYRNIWFSVDGHHRLYYLYKNGVKKIKVKNELSDNNHKLYQLLADEALDLKLKTIEDLEDRFLCQKEYEEKWVNKCQQILKEIKE